MFSDTLFGVDGDFDADGDALCLLWLTHMHNHALVRMDTYGFRSRRMHGSLAHHVFQI